MYGKAKVGRPDWYMMGICIVFALTFSLRSVPLAVLLLLFMPFSLLSLTGELPLPTRNAPIFQTLLCISIPLLVIGAFSSLLLLLPRLLIPSACVWLFGGALLLFLTGVVFCYFAVYSLAVDFFLVAGDSLATPMLSIDKYVSFLFGFLVPFGVAFQLPVVLYLTTRVGLTTPDMLRSKRKYVILAIFVLAAILTPPDVV